MLLRTKLVIAYSTLVVSVVGGLLLISDFALEDLTRRNLGGADRALSEITQANNRLAENILSRNGEQFVASVARSATDCASCAAVGRGNFSPADPNSSLANWLSEQPKINARGPTQDISVVHFRDITSAYGSFDRCRRIAEVLRANVAKASAQPAVRVIGIHPRVPEH